MYIERFLAWIGHDRELVNGLVNGLGQVDCKQQVRCFISQTWTPLSLAWLA